MKYACEQQLYLGELGIQNFFLSGEITSKRSGHVTGKLEVMQLLLPGGAAVSLHAILCDETRAYVEAAFVGAYVEETENERHHFRETSRIEGA
jgi:hypothetical protein